MAREGAISLSEGNLKGTHTEPVIDERLLRLMGLALPTAVWVLGVIPPPRAGMTPGFLVPFTALLVGMMIVDQTAPRGDSPVWRRLLWFSAEILIAFFVVRVHGSLVRPALVYLLPVSRVLFMFGARGGVVLSLFVRLAYIINVGFYAFPDKFNEYPNYLSFFLGPYVLALMLSLITLQQESARRRVQSLYDELSKAHEELQHLHEETRELTVTQERNRLAREIHDTLAHYLTIINVQLEVAEKLGQGNVDKAFEQVRKARRLAVESLQEVRRSVAALRAPSLDRLSLARAISRLASEFTENTGVPVKLEVAIPDDIRIAPGSALALYRAAQEGLTNVQKHAQAKTVRLSLVMRNGSVDFAVEDDGVGPSQANAGDKGGFGILGLKERVELLGGQLVFGRSSSGGSRLAITVPVGESHERPGI